MFMVSQYICNILKILWRIDPLLNSDSGQQLGKHVPIARQQILNNATTEQQQWKWGIFYVVLAEMLKLGGLSLVES
jgi:hypothetical protein